MNLNLNSLLVKRQIDNPSPGAVTGNWSGNYRIKKERNLQKKQLLI